MVIRVFKNAFYSSVQKKINKCPVFFFRQLTIIDEILNQNKEKLINNKR